jgi:hypothetical protein
MTSSLLGIFAVLLALLGAVLAANAIDTGMFTFGLGLVAFGAFFVYWLTKDYFDQREKASPET